MKRLLCYFIGHRWSHDTYYDEPDGWQPMCGRCDGRWNCVAAPYEWALHYLMLPVAWWRIGWHRLCLRFVCPCGRRRHTCGRNGCDGIPF